MFRTALIVWGVSLAWAGVRSARDLYASSDFLSKGDRFQWALGYALAGLGLGSLLLFVSRFAE